ncbi:homoserine kinase [Syncephalis plumigaleata]|nr:homoserine kinase [Syncephalis plumigaleata]
MSQRIRITVPASTSNIGPGFDVMGLALSLYLTVEADYDVNSTQHTSTDSIVDVLSSWTLCYTGDSADTVPLEPYRNLITKTAADLIVRYADVKAIPQNVQIRVDNPIPLGRGLGSSGAAVVAGIVLGDTLGQLNLSMETRLKECLAIEHHPDNVTAALAGGWVACWTDVEGKAGFARLPINASVRAITVSPRFEVKTEDARGVLPKQYSLNDVIFNLQRITQLTAALGAVELDAEQVHRAMQDRIHQPYRKSLIPGMDTLLETLTPSARPGLLGVCISGSGPTVLALVDDQADTKALCSEICNVFKSHNIESDARVLDVERRGAHCEIVTKQD